jgi:putative sigma-54 modulation protein
MKVNVHAVNFTVDQKLVNFIQDRLDKLEKYYDRVVAADVYLKVNNTSEKENKIVEVKLHVPGDDFLVEKQCKSFEEAVDQTMEACERVLVKRKEKIRTFS